MTKKSTKMRARQLVAGAPKAVAGATGTPRTLYLVRRAQFTTYLRLEERLKPFGLTAAQYTVMSMLGHSGRLSSAQLSRRFEVTPQTMFKLLAPLRRKGLIARRGVNSDRRALEVSLTPAGRRVLAQCEAAIDALEAELFRGFTGRELRNLRALLAKFLAENRRAG
ncbi:MAG TPA: MarR family transcriptional regulator [Alphaproteobacteria bacterium]|jgi:DNA-binding MarR family transcriptional regulator|nr:MarR family transcriptional regulator [Alphaproteobacteria bacterium]